MKIKKVLYQDHKLGTRVNKYIISLQQYRQPIVAFAYLSQILSIQVLESCLHLYIKTRYFFISKQQQKNFLFYTISIFHLILFFIFFSLLPLLLILAQLSIYFKYNEIITMHTNQKQTQRFKRVINQLNRSTQLKNSQIAPKPVSQISLFGRSSANESQRSTRYTHTPTHFKKTEINEEVAIDILMESYQVMVNRSRTSIKTEFIPTSKGLKYVLLFGDQLYVNLSWVHSAQELQKNKILILYYRMQKIRIREKPTIESLVIEFSQQSQLNSFLSAILFIHEHYHDDEVEKVYHQLCSN